MAKYLILIISLTLFLSGTAQKCKIITDKITGEKVIVSVGKHTAFEYRNNIVKFTLGVSFGGDLNAIVAVNSEFIFKPEGGEANKLQTIAASSPVPQVYATQYSAGVITYYNFTFEIDKVVLDKFMKGKAFVIRCPMPGQEGKTFDIVDKKFSKEMNKGAKFLLTNM